MSNSSDIIQYIMNVDLKYKDKILDNFVNFSLLHNSSDEIIELILGKHRYNINPEVSFYELELLRFGVLNKVKNDYHLEFKYNHCFLSKIMQVLIEILSDKDETIMKKLMKSKFVKYNRMFLNNYIVRNFIPEYLKIFEYLLDIEIAGRYSTITYLTINEIHHINNKDYKKQFCDFCICYMKNCKYLLEYILIVNSMISSDILKEIEFTFNVRKIEKLSKNQNITNIDILMYLSQDDNFHEFLKINKDELIESCNDECKKYIESFL